MAKRLCRLALVVGLAVMSAGCWSDPRPGNLRRGVTIMLALLARPRLHALARKQGGKLTASTLVDALFSHQGRELWPGPPAIEASDQPLQPHRLPPRILFLRNPDAPWSVVVAPGKQQNTVVVEGFGMNLRAPLVRSQFVVSGGG